MKRHLFAVAGFFLAAAAACEGYTRTNPLDPEYPLELAIVGPDSIFSVNDTVTFQVVTEPSHPNLEFTWSTSNPARLGPLSTSPGRFTSLENGPAVLRVTYGAHFAEKEVVVKQRAVRLRIATPPSTQLASLGEELNLSAAVVDARGTPVEGSAAVVLWSSTDPTVAPVDNGRVTALKNGTVWIKATGLAQRDSVQVRIQQVPVTLEFGNDNYTIGLPGGSVQTLIAARDARGNIIVAPPGLTITSSRNNFQVSLTGLVQSTAYGSTTITARLNQLTATTLVRVSGGTSPIVTGVAAGLTTLELPVSTFNFLIIELDTRDAELDSDEATLEVYSTVQTFMAIRVVPLQQGVAEQTTVLAFPSLPGAGTVRVRLRDAAQNGSDLSVWNVVTYPRPNGPDLSIEGTTLVGDNIDVRVLLTRGEDDLRNIHLVALTTTGQLALLRSRAVTGGSAAEVETSITANLPPGVQLAFIGVVASDVEGRFSIVRRVSP